jgi:hypothetical protein
MGEYYFFGTGADDFILGIVELDIIDNRFWAFSESDECVLLKIIHCDVMRVTHGSSSDEISTF